MPEDEVVAAAVAVVRSSESMSVTKSDKMKFKLQFRICGGDGRSKNHPGYTIQTPKSQSVERINFRLPIIRDFFEDAAELTETRKAFTLV